MTPIEQRAWARLTADMAGGMHQYDYWGDVPEDVRRRYLDRELLELAAKAAGVDVWWTNEYGGCFLRQKSCPVIWNPLTDDGDALRLAVKLALIPTQDSMLQLAWANDQTGEVAGEATYKECDLCEYAATRRAIVHAAAAMAQGDGR